MNHNYVCSRNIFSVFIKWCYVQGTLHWCYVGTLHIEDKYKYILHVHIIRYAFGDDIDRSQMRCGLFYLDH